MKITEETQCRVCRGKLSVGLDLGEIYPSGFIPKDQDSSMYSKAPLVLAKCDICGLVQLKHTVELDSMYRQYWYTSSLNKSMLKDLKDVVENVLKLLGQPNDEKYVAVDIGCNDGSMFDFYPQYFNKVGFDPALNLKDKACAHCNHFINNYFDDKLYPDELPKADIVTAIAMFYDLPDPVKFVKMVSNITKDGGLFVIQFTDLLSMCKINAFDNICHEHLEYYRLIDVIDILRDGGFAPLEVSYNNVNGGSVRVVSHKVSEKRLNDDIILALRKEQTYFESINKDPFSHINTAIVQTKAKMRRFLDAATKSGDRVFIMGASTKGNTLLQLCGITNKDIPYAFEVNKEKFGLKTLGSDIEILPEEKMYEYRPDYLLLLPWHFIDNIAQKQKVYLDAGGKLVVPLPRFSVITDTGGFLI